MPLEVQLLQREYAFRHDVFPSCSREEYLNLPYEQVQWMLGIHRANERVKAKQRG